MKKNLFPTILALVCAICCVFSLVACDNGADTQKVAVTGIMLNKTELTLEIGGEETLTATVTPSNSTDKTVTWTTDNPNVADVTMGKVTAKKAGTAVITAKAKNISATCTVTVNAVVTDTMTQSEFESALALAVKPLPPVNVVVTSEAKFVWYDDGADNWGTEVSEETYVDKADNGKYEMSYTDGDYTETVYMSVTENDGVYEYTGYDYYKPYEEPESHGAYWDAALEEWVPTGECTMETPHWHKYSYSVQVNEFVYASDNYAQFIGYFTWTNFEYNAEKNCYENRAEMDIVRGDGGAATISEVKLYFANKKLTRVTFVCQSDGVYKANIENTFEYGTAAVALPEGATNYPAYEEQ